MKLLGRYINGNTKTTIFSDGTRIRETEADEFVPAFADNMDIKITDACDMGCLACHEGSTLNGKHADILNEKFIDTLHPFQEVAIGGGDATSHPDLIPFLEKLREKKVIANMTVNQRHFEQKQDLIRKLIEEKLIWGLGVSLVAPTPEFISLVKQYPNAVIHVINGLFTEDELDKLQDHGLKILILGYKRLRRGERFYQDKEYYIAANMEMLKGRLGDMISRFNVVSFDNLAITQLGVQNMLSPEDWERFYAGDDGTHTYYIDMVNRKFAQSSTAPFDERYDLLDSVDEMFDVITRRKAAA